MLTVIYFFKEGYEYNEDKDSNLRSADKYIVSYADKENLIKATGMGWLDIFALAGKLNENFNAITNINWEYALDYAYSLFLKIERTKDSFCKDKLMSFTFYNSYKFTIEKIINTIKYILQQDDANKYYVWVE